MDHVGRQLQGRDVLFVIDDPCHTGGVEAVFVDEDAAWDHRHFNLEVPEFAGAIPTSENIAIAAWRRLEPPIAAAHGARLAAVTPSARKPPSRMCGSADGRLSNSTGT